MEWSNVWGQFKTQLSATLDTLLPKSGGILTGDLYLKSKNSDNKLTTLGEVDNRIECYEFNFECPQKNVWYQSDKTINNYTNRMFLCVTGEGAYFDSEPQVRLISSSGGDIGLNGDWDVQISDNGIVSFKCASPNRNSTLKIISIPCKFV